MTILYTNMTTSMINRSGYVDFRDVFEEQFDTYVFQHCIKVKNAKFDEWVMFWGGTPIVRCKVMCSVLPTGFTKVVIVSKEMVDASVVGAYPSKHNFCTVSAIGQKHSDFRNTVKATVDVMKNEFGAEPVRATQTSQAEVQRYADSKLMSAEETQTFKDIIAQNWGCTLK